MSIGMMCIERICAAFMAIGDDILVSFREQLPCESIDTGIVRQRNAIRNPRHDPDEAQGSYCLRAEGPRTKSFSSV